MTPPPRLPSGAGPSSAVGGAGGGPGQASKAPSHVLEPSPARSGHQGTLEAEWAWRGRGEWGWGAEATRGSGRGPKPGPGPTGSPRAEGEELVLSLDRKTNDPIMGA